jgi:hypothetical protein
MKRRNYWEIAATGGVFVLAGVFTLWAVWSGDLAAFWPLAIVWVSMGVMTWEVTR